METKDKQSAKDVGPNQLPSYVKTFSNIFGPQDVRILGLDHQLYDRLFSFYVVKPVGMEHPWETFLTHLYKCDPFATDCFFSTNSLEAFKAHCNDKHDTKRLFCRYCNEEQLGGEDRDPDDAYDLDELVGHLEAEHENQSHQCNLCYYRAVDRHQVFVHQALEHPRQFTATLLKVLTEKANEEKLTPFEQELVKNLEDRNCAFYQFEEDKYEQLDGRLEHACIIHKPDRRVEGDELAWLTRFGAEFEIEDIKANINDDAYYQCAYCSTGAAVTSDDLLVHWCQEHPQAPFLAIDLLAYAASQHNLDDNFAAIVKHKLKVRDGNTNKLVLRLDHRHELEDEDCESLLAMVETFKSTLVDYRYSQTYSAELMQKARKASEPQGVKRKHEDDEDEPGLLVALGQRLKRLRPSPRNLRGNSLARFVGTTAVAFGLYHLGNLAMQNFINQN